MSRDLKKKCPRCNLFRRKTKGSRQSYRWGFDTIGRVVCYVCVEHLAAAEKAAAEGSRERVQSLLKL